MSDQSTDSIREWWQNLDQIVIVAAASLDDLPNQERPAAQRRIEKAKLSKSLKRKILRAGGIKNPRTPMRPFVPNASDCFIGQMQNEMLTELGVRGPAVWAAYYGAPINGHRIWVVGVPLAEGGLSALYAHISAEAEFKTENAAMDAKQELRTPVSQPPESSVGGGSEATAAVRDSASRRATEMLSSNSQHESPRKWEDLEISFLSDERIQTRISGEIQRTFNYAEFGFEDGRNGKPNSAWETLRAMACTSGTIPRPLPGKDKVTIQKRIEEIRKKLRGHFKIQTDPIPFDGNTYKASFKISRRPSSDK